MVASYHTMSYYPMTKQLPMYQCFNMAMTPWFYNSFDFTPRRFDFGDGGGGGGSPNFSPGDINDILQSDRNAYKVSLKSLGNGLKVFACRWSRFGKVQKALLDQVKNMLQAAKELGVTILFSDAERTKAESNASRARKGSIVCAGGKSPHNYGAAFDIVLYKDGKAVDVNSALQTKFANRLRELSHNQIEWGGEWRKKGERHHFQLRGWKAKYKNAANLVG